MEEFDPVLEKLREKRNSMIREYLKSKKGMSDTNIDYFIKEFDGLSEEEKSEVIYEMVGKEVYKMCPVGIRTFVNDPYFLGEIYGGCLFKIWRDMLDEIYPAPFCKKYDHIVLSCATRCFGKGTKILMYDGSVKNVEDIVVGDKIMGPDNEPRNVRSLARGQEEMYKIIPARGGNSFICNASHKLALKYVRIKKGRKNYGKYLDIEVKDYLKLPEFERKKHLRMYHSGAIEYPKKDLLIDPYIMGSWLGDGYTNRMSLSTVDKELIESWKEYHSTLSEDYKFDVTDIGKNGNSLYMISIHKGKTYASKSDPIKLYIKEIKETYGHKRIPQEYLTSTIEDRLALLAGIIDTDGYKGSKGNECYRSISTKYKDLAEDYATLARSLGFRATVHERNKKLSYKDEIYTSYEVNLTGDFNKVPTKLSRKSSTGKVPVRDHSITEFAVEPLGIGNYYGFEVDKDHKFLLSDYLVQNNSGKTFMTACVMCYEIYLLTCMINPIKSLNVANIVIAILSKDNSTAISQIGGEIYKCLTQSPYFKGVIKEKLSFSKVDKDGVRITDDIIIKAGSSMGTVIGTNLYAGCIDEANAPSPRIAAEHLVEERMKIYLEMQDRRSASYDKAPKMTGMLMFTSSPTDEGDVLSEIIDDIGKKDDVHALIRDNIPRWEAREEEVDETFDFFLGSNTKDPCIMDESIRLKPEEYERVIQIPIKYYDQFNTDPYKAIQDIAGRRTMPETALFNTVSVFEKVFYKDNDIFSKDEPKVSLVNGLSLEDFLYEDKKDYFSHPNKPECFRYIHLDLAYRCDKFGIASVYSDRMKYTDEEGHEIFRRKYYVDFCLGVNSESKESVDILKVLEFIYLLKEKGYPLKLVTTDNHQGEIARQIISKGSGRSVRTEYLSLEKSKEQYLNMKNIIISQALEGYKNPPLMRDLRGLRESQKKIEKGKGYTDDMSNALAGALWTCSQDKFYKKNNEAISEIIKQTGDFNKTISNNINIHNMVGFINKVPGNKGNLGFRYGR